MSDGLLCVGGTNAGRRVQSAGREIRLACTVDFTIPEPHAVAAEVEMKTETYVLVEIHFPNQPSIMFWRESAIEPRAALEMLLTAYARMNGHDG